MRTFAFLLLSIIAVPVVAQKHAPFNYYFTEVYSRISAHYVRPPTAQDHNCVLRLSVTPQGGLLAVQVVNCSNVDAQRAAIAAVAAALPLPAPPEGVNSVEINFRKADLGAADPLIAR